MKIIVASHGKYAHGIVNAAKRLAVVDSALYEICAYEDCRTINELFDAVLDENNENILDENNWLGQNLLGKCITNCFKGE